MSINDLTFEKTYVIILIITFIISFILALVCSQMKLSYLYPIKIMGSAGFEPTTSGTQNPNHTKLDHDPDVMQLETPQFKLHI